MNHLKGNPKKTKKSLSHFIFTFILNGPSCCNNYIKRKAGHLHWRQWAIVAFRCNALWEIQLRGTFPGWCSTDGRNKQYRYHLPKWRQPSPIRGSSNANTWHSLRRECPQTTKSLPDKAWKGQLSLSQYRTTDQMTPWLHYQSPSTLCRQLIRIASKCPFIFDWFPLLNCLVKQLSLPRVEVSK